MKSIFSFYIMKDFTNSSFAWNYYGFIIKFICITGKYIFRTNIKGIFSVVYSILTIATTSSNFCHFTYLHEFHSIRTKFLNQSFKIFHAAPPSNCITISSISFLSCSSLATISEIRVFSSVMSIFSRVSSCSTYVETERL